MLVQGRKRRSSPPRPDRNTRVISYTTGHRIPPPRGFEGWPVPEVVLETSPGDVIAFDAHLSHRSAGGQKRLAWTIEYIGWAVDKEGRHRVRDAVDDAGYDRDRWVTWTEWAASPATSPASRQTAIQRLRLIGVLGDG